MHYISTYSNQTDEDTDDFSDRIGEDTGCSRHRSYQAIIITVLPLWVILTTLIVFLLLSFHRNLRATKVYDNCTKSSAQHTYYVEMRTGDTSSTYNRRRTTLNIDMFDDNQITLARVAVPGHVIFGRKDSPIIAIDDEKYFELRVTRFWLYRATRLRKVSTIRLTHTCMEPEARLMVYGVEIRSSESDKYKFFFPVMSYISAFGSSSKPNACYDLEPQGSISAIGGSQSETSSVSENLSWVDYTILIYLLGALIIYMTSHDLIQNSFREAIPSIYKGAIAGSVAFIVTFVSGLVFKHLVKFNYSLRIGLGFWAYMYYVTCIILVLISSSIWIFTIIYSYKYVCPDFYQIWSLSISVAVAEVILLSILCSFILWVIQLLNPKYTEQYVLPEDTLQTEPPSKGRVPYRYLTPVSKQPVMNVHPVTHQPWPQSPVHMVVPTGYPYSQPVMTVNPNSPYKTLPTSYPSYQFEQALPTYQAPTQQASPITVHHPTYHQQTTTNLANVQGFKATPKKIGSTESTGSTYYQQLMKNKGGVKSISQYGELLKQKKVNKHLTNK